MRRVLVLFLLVAPGCNGPCWDMDETNNDGCNSDPVERHGVYYEAQALGAAEENFVAVVEVDNYSGASYETMLVKIDREGVVLTTDRIEETNVSPAIAGIGAGSMLLLETWGSVAPSTITAWWYDSGTLVAQAAIDDADDVIAAQDGTYWIAASTAPRQLRQFDTSGSEVSTHVLGDESSWVRGSSLAIDPFGGDVAAAWLVEDPSGGRVDRVIVDRIRGETISTFELAVLDSTTRGDPWISTVAIHDGTAAVLYGLGLDANIGLVSPDGQVRTMPFELPPSCTGYTITDPPVLARLVGTASGFAVACENYVSVVDAEGVAYGGQGTLPHPRLATERGGAIVMNDDEHGSLYVHGIDTQLGPTTTLFVGTYYVDGCSSSSPSLGMLMLAIGPLLLRRRRRSR